MLKYIIRDIKQGDLSYLIGTSVAIISGTRPYSKIPHAAFQVAVPYILETLLLFGAKGYVACDPDDQDLIFGISLGTEDTLWACVVKPVYQKQGIGTALYRALFPEAREVKCPIFTSWASKRQEKWGLVYSEEPYKTLNRRIKTI